MLEWNATLCTSVNDLRLKERSILVSFETQGGYERVIQEGIIMFGAHYQTTPYGPWRTQIEGPCLRLILAPIR
jgi:hypothetical protein